MSILDDRSGTTLGHYEIGALLGRGGMGRVYRATDTRKGRTVALKLLHPDLADNQAFRDRFERESRVAARLNDPHVVPIHDWGEIDGLLFIDMRLVAGQDLREILSTTGALPPERAIMILSQVADALDAAHADGLVHRDVKPDNILVDSRDFTYLADFGLAQGAADTRLTTAGAAIGSFGYMAPERFGTDEVGAAGDIYALACVLYECLSGAQPFASATTIEQLIAAHLNADPPRTGSGLDPVIARGMAKDPAARYASAGELIDAARNAPAATGSPPTIPPSGSPKGLPHNSIVHTPTPLTGHSADRRTGRGYDPTALRPVPGPVSPAHPARQQLPMAMPPPGFPAASGPSGYPTPSSRGSSSVVTLLLVIALLLVAGIGVGGWLLLRGSDTTSTDAVTPPSAITAPGPSATTATTTTATTTTTTTTAAAAAYDLGLSIPISTPACDGTGIVVVGNATNPSTYAAEVQSYLDQFPGSRYLRTDQSCSSLRARDDNGNPIYAVYQVAGRTLADICRLRNQIGGNAYGKWLDNTTDPTSFIQPSQCDA